MGPGPGVQQMQVYEKLKKIIGERPVTILLRVFITLLLIAVLYASTLLPPPVLGPPSYDVDVAVGVMLKGATINGQPTTTPMVTILVKGGEGAERLRTLTISIGNRTVGEMDPPGKQKLRWINTGQHYPVQDPNGNHVVATGHFDDGKDVVLVDTTV